MKRKLLYALMVCSALFIASACSNDYEDATSPHVYGPDENPPVKSDATSTISNVYEMQGTNPTPISLNIDLYEDVIQKQFGMTVSEMLTNIEKGTVVVCPINPSRNVWNKAKANVDGKQYGWYVNKSGNVCKADDEALYGIIEFDPASHNFNFYADENAGGAASIEIGFALNGPNYNTGIRFVNSITIYDRSFIFMDIKIPAGDYSAYQLNFNDVAENINFVFGMSSVDFANSLSDGILKLYMMNLETNAYLWDGESTANNGGYWCNSKNEICAWGADVFSYFIEPNIGDDSATFAIGRAPGIASGTVYLIKFGVASSDQSKMLSFFITATFE